MSTVSEIIKGAFGAKTPDEVIQQAVDTLNEDLSTAVPFALPRLLHLRFRDDDSRVDNFGGGTIATMPNPNSAELLRMSFVACAADDNFSRSKGRELALARLAEGNYLNVSADVFGQALAVVKPLFQDFDEAFLKAVVSTVVGGDFSYGPNWTPGPLQYLTRAVNTEVLAEPIIE